jgi:TolB-like protein
VWSDEALPAHRAYAEVIQERLEAASAVLVLWSAEAVKSQWVRSEANRGREGRKLVQARLDQTGLPMPFDQIQCADLSDWRGHDSAAWRQVVEALAELASPGAIPERPASPRPLPSAPIKPRRWPMLAGAGAAVALVLAVGAFALLHSPAPNGTLLRTVAVMPIRNLTGDAGDDAEADRLTEDLINVLGRSGDIQVIPRDAVFAFKDKSVDARTLGKTFGAGSIVIASLRAASPGHRVSYQVVDAQSGQVVDAREVGAASPDLPGADNRLALNLFSDLARPILKRWRDHELAQPPNDKDPENVFARMSSIDDRGDMKDLPAFTSLIELARTAIPREDPRRAPFNVHACDYLQTLLTGGHYRSAAERAQWADQALTLGAEAVALRPGATAPHLCRAAAFGALERWDEGMAEANYVIDTFPLTANGYGVRGDLEFARGRFADSLKDYEERATRIGGDAVDIGATKLFMGDYPGAVADLRQAVAQDPSDPSAPFYLAAALQLSGHHDDAVTAAQAYLKLKTNDDIWQYLATSREPAFVAAAATVRKGLQGAGLNGPARSS